MVKDTFPKPEVELKEQLPKQNELNQEESRLEKPSQEYTLYR